MPARLGEILPSFSGPLQTVTFTYKPPYEVQPAVSLPASKPSTPQGYAEFGPYPNMYGFTISPEYLIEACQVATIFFANLTNWDSTSRTLYYEVWVRGAKYSSGSGTMSAQKTVRFYAYPNSLYPANLGAAAELYLWTNSPDATLDYICIYAIPSRLSIKPGYLHTDITFVMTSQPVLVLGSGDHTVASSFGQPWLSLKGGFFAGLGTSTGARVVSPYVYDSEYGLFRAALGDFSTISGYVTSYSVTSVVGAPTPSSISFRVTPFRVQ